MPDKIARTPASPFVRLDFQDKSILYTRPIEVVQTRDPDSVDACLDQLRGRDAAGFLAYEAGLGLEPRLSPIAEPAAEGEPPLLWFGIFERAEQAPPLPPSVGAWAGQPEPQISFEDYSAAVAEIRTNIADGDVYQVNLTFPCNVPIAGDPLVLYAQLRERAQAQWSALVFTGAHWLLSCSPEVFFTLADGQVMCRPMKGTAPPDSDPKLLADDPKNRAENLMIVDLVRNDLSRIGKAASVKVPALFAVEAYPTLLQMTSTVIADLKDELDAIDILKTIFPCGSITGAPKIAAIERIAALERSTSGARGPYTGSIGHISRNGDAAFNVAIRTLVLGNDLESARYNVGSAIVIDSDAPSEWAECLQKAAFVASTRQFALIETFALGQLPSPVIALHLDRLERSARALQFRLDRSTLEEDLIQLQSGLDDAVRLRILLQKSGDFCIETRPLPGLAGEPVSVSIAARAIAANDFRLAYKTTDRRFYDEAREASGNFEILFTDEEGFLTEGSFTNLFVDGGNCLLTPPASRGLLPGILRQQLIGEGKAIERELRPIDLEEGFWIGNSLRGLMPAKLEHIAVDQ